MLRVTHTLLEDLPRIVRTGGRAWIYAANGHGEGAAVSNILSRGQTVLFLKAVCSPSAGQDGADDEREDRGAEGVIIAERSTRRRSPSASGEEGWVRMFADVYPTGNAPFSLEMGAALRPGFRMLSREWTIARRSERRG
jgi:hypothetical protein